MCSKFYDENAPRVPDNAAVIPFVSREMDYWSSELYRRRDPDSMLHKDADFIPLPDTLEEWKVRRQEVLKNFQQHVYGAIPPAPDRMEYKLLNEKTDALDNTAVRREIRVYCRMDNGRSFDFDVMVYFPKNVAKAPVFAGLNFDGNQANTPEDDVRDIIKGRRRWRDIRWMKHF